MEARLTMTPPPPCFTICRCAHLQPRKTPLRLMPTTAFQPLTEISSGRERNEAPALLIITSRRPKSRAARSTTACTCSSTRTSTAIANVRRPSLRTASATGSRCSTFRLQMATSAPARANSMAIDLPMPVPPPVTMAVRPSRENGDFMDRDDTRFLCGLSGSRDLGLPPRHFAVEPSPHVHRRQRGAVALRTRLQLAQQGTGFVEALARRLGSLAHPVVTGRLRFQPRLLDVSRHEYHAVDLPVDVGFPLVAAGEARAVALHDPFEVLGDLGGLADVVVDARPHVGRGLGSNRGRQQADERERDKSPHARSIATDAAMLLTAVVRRPRACRATSPRRTSRRRDGRTGGRREDPPAR